MPAYLGAPECLGLEVVTVMPHKPTAPIWIPIRARCSSSRRRAWRPRSPSSTASAITGIRTAAVSGAAMRTLAKPDANDLAILGTGVQAVTHLEAMCCVRPPRRSCVEPLGRARAQVRRSASRSVTASTSRASRSGARGRRGREPHLHDHRRRRADPGWAIGSPPAPTHQRRGRMASDDARAGHRGDASSRATCTSIVASHASTSGRLPARQEGGRDRRRPHPRRVGRGVPRARSGADVGERRDALQVARNRRRGSRRRALDLAQGEKTNAGTSIEFGGKSIAV